MQPQCLRCGTCCGNYFCIVPKNEDSDLSEKFLEKYAEEYGFEKMNEYIEENSIPQGKRCKWLLQNSLSEVASCTAYTRRCSMCIDYVDSQWCNIGIMEWKHREEENYQIPEEIMEILKYHPLYKKVFGEGK